MAAYIETDRRVLHGWIEHEVGSDEKAIELMRSAAALEESSEKHPVTPGALQPPNEALGDLLMTLDQPAEALKAYKASDDVWPGRLNTLLGAAVAARSLGEDQKARNYIRRLLPGTEESQAGDVILSTE